MRGFVIKKRGLAGCILTLAAVFSQSVTGQALRFDFQPATGILETGYTAVSHQNLYSPAVGYGFIQPPARSVDGSAKTWNFFGRIVTVDQAIPTSVLSDATRDGVLTESARGDPVSMVFQVDVTPGEYDVTVWLGDVTTPRFRNLVNINGNTASITRMDVNHRRGQFDQTVIGNAVPVRLRASAADGVITLVLGRDDAPSNDFIFGTLAANGAATSWIYDLDESALQPPSMQTAVLVPGFDGVALQALEIVAASDLPLQLENGELMVLSAPFSEALQAAVTAYNSGDLDSALSGFNALNDPALQAARAAGLLWVAGHPALFSGEENLLNQALSILDSIVQIDPDDAQARALRRQAAMAADAERYRRLLGYAAAESSAAENLGRSAALAETFPIDHPYHRKGQILWLRNRGGLDPNRNSVSWERAQFNAGLLDAQWGKINPHVHLYATDEWQNDGQPWARVDWNQILTDGPDWARKLAANLNSWLDLFEWWTIHRQSSEGDIGGGWTDDVEIVPAFGMMALALPGVSDLTEFGFRQFADGIWASEIIDQDAGFQAQFADVEHVAEASGNLLHIMLLENYGDPEAVERLLKSARTFRDVFISDPAASPLAHTHFLANHMSATEIAADSQFSADIPLDGRVTQPFPFLQWYANHPGMAVPLQAWVHSWLEDAGRTENNKPWGVFPNAVWTPGDLVGFPDGNWWAAVPANGQFDALPVRHDYLYGLTGFFYSWTGDPSWLDPFTAIEDHTNAWLAAGEPKSEPIPAAPFHIWAGGKLKGIATGALLNVWSMSGTKPAQAYMARFAKGYARLRLDPKNPAPLNSLDGPTSKLIKQWPYKTTEGVMTDRILVPGWADVISYYIGADISALFEGMPAHAVSWENTTRLFAAVVTDAAPDHFAASVYLFSPAERTIGLRFWQLRPGVQYRLEAGPAADLGADPTTLAVSLPFQLEHRGDAISLKIPGQTTFAIRVVASTALPAADLPPAPIADVGLARRDVNYDAASQSLAIRVHNIGAVDLNNVQVMVFPGADTQGTPLAQQQIQSLPAPLDLTPQWVDLSLPGISSGDTVTVLLATPAAEVTLVNNQVMIEAGADMSPLSPPQILTLDPPVVAAGGVVTLLGNGFSTPLLAMDAGVINPNLQITVLDEHTAKLNVGAQIATPVQIMLSLASAHGLESNIMPLSISGPMRGLFWDRARSGHGFDLQRSGNTWFLLMYTYRDNNTPLWYLAVGTLSNGVFSAMASQFAWYDTGVQKSQIIPGTGGPMSIDFKQSSIANANACNDGTDRSTANQLGVFVFELDGAVGQWCVEPYQFGVGPAVTDFTGSWYNSGDPGWGVTIYTRQSQTGGGTDLVVVLYYYDADGQPRWALGVLLDADLSTEVSVPMAQFTGFCLTCDTVPVSATQSGTVRLLLTTPSTSLGMGNVANIDVNFLGAPGGQWLRTETDIQQLSDLPD